MMSIQKDNLQDTDNFHSSFSLCCFLFFIVFKMLVKVYLCTKFALSVAMPPREVATFHSLWSDNGIRREWFVGAVFRGVILFTTKGAAAHTLLLGLLGNNDLFCFKFCLFVCFEFWASSSVVSWLTAVSTFSHSFPTAQLWLSIVQ